MKKPFLFSVAGVAAVGTLVWLVQSPAPHRITSAWSGGKMVEPSHLPEARELGDSPAGSRNTKLKRDQRINLKERLAAFSKVAGSSMEPHEFELYLEEWLQSVSISEMPRTLTWMMNSGMNHDLVIDVTGRLMRKWVNVDADAATAFLSTMPEGPARERAVENVSIIRSSQDLETASQWAKKLPEGPERELALLAIANEAARSNPVDSLRLSSGMAATPATDDLIRRAAMEWGAKDAPAVIEWIRGIEGDDALCQKVLSGVALSWAEQDPSSAAGLVAGALSAGRNQLDAAVGVFQRWSQSDPQAALEWVGSLPDGDLKTSMEGNDVVIQVAKNQSR